MDVLLNTLLAAIGFLSFIPVVSMYKSRERKKYGCLRYLLFTTFFWTILIFSERFISNSTVIYYLHLLSFPVKFLLAATMLCTIFDYIEKSVPKWVLIIIGIIFIFELAISLPNNYTQYMIKLTIDQTSSYKDLYTSENGPLFIVHLLLTYLTLVSSLTYLFVFLRKHRDIVSYRSVTKTMIISSLLVLVFNIIQITVSKNPVDLTYISLVIVVYVLYKVIYANDMIFNLRTSGRGEILSNMREMYIITDSEKRIVEISKLLSNKYNIEDKLYVGKTLSELTENLSDQVVFYTEYEVKTEDSSEKNHLHLREKKFTLKGLKDFGYMILLYDETQVFNLLRELNKLSNFDQMTGLNNRNYVEKLFEKIETRNIGVLSLDLNGLKVNNDYLGHERGDYLLKQLSSYMKQSCQGIEKKEMARIGGDEFIIILPNTTQKDVLKTKEAILKLCDNQDILEKVSLSIGSSFNSDEQKSIYEIIKEADKTMYEMKRVSSSDYSEQIVKYAHRNSKFIR